MNRVRERMVVAREYEFRPVPVPEKGRAIAVAGREWSSKEEKNTDGLSLARSIAYFAPNVNALLASMHW